MTGHEDLIYAALTLGALWWAWDAAKLLLRRRGNCLLCPDFWEWLKKVKP